MDESNQKPTTGKLTEKLYRCGECGHETRQTTNHYGETYSLGSYNACPKCPPYKRPTTWKCAEEPPAGMGVPAPWKKTTVKEAILTDLVASGAVRVSKPRRLNHAKLYPLADVLGVQARKELGLGCGLVKAEASGEKRPPRKGEWYLSGAQIAAYRAPNDLSTAFHIARLVQI